MKSCPEDKVLNPKTNRCVKKNGRIGRMIAKEEANNAANLLHLPAEMIDNVVSKMSPNTLRNVRMANKQLKEQTKPSTTLSDMLQFPKLYFYNNKSYLHTDILIPNPMIPGKMLIIRLNIKANNIEIWVRKKGGEGWGYVSEMTWTENGDIHISTTWPDNKTWLLYLRLPLLIFHYILRRTIDLEHIPVAKTRKEYHSRIASIIRGLQSLPKKPTSLRVIYGYSGTEINLRNVLPSHTFTNMDELITYKADVARKEVDKQLMY